jgi:hypothetical protein
VNWPKHVPLLTSGCDPDGYHVYGPWSRPYRAFGENNEHQTWHERRCQLGDGCKAAEWEILDLDLPPVTVRMSYDGGRTWKDVKYVAALVVNESGTPVPAATVGSNDVAAWETLVVPGVFVAIGIVLVALVIWSLL